MLPVDVLGSILLSAGRKGLIPLNPLIHCKASHPRGSNQQLRGSGVEAGGETDARFAAASEHSQEPSGRLGPPWAGLAAGAWAPGRAIGGWRRGQGSAGRCR